MKRTISASRRPSLLSSSSRHGLKTSLITGWAPCATIKVGNTCLGGLKRFASTMASKDNTLSEIGLSRMVLQRGQNRTIEEGVTGVLSMLYESGLPSSFWGEAMASLIHVSNRVTTTSLQGATPHQAFYGSKPNLSHLRVWGCTAYVLLQKEKQASNWKPWSAHGEVCLHWISSGL
jgi:hypothetical protein